MRTYGGIYCVCLLCQPRAFERILNLMCEIFAICILLRFFYGG